MPYFVYILESESTSQFYVGHTDDIERRLSQHNDPHYRGSKHKKRFSGPWRCVYTELFTTRSAAMSREKQIKAKKSRAHIESLICSRQSPECLRD
ncbi:MAG: GIY-YIG nuclease family protein [bacterium]